MSTYRSISPLLVPGRWPSGHGGLLCFSRAASPIQPGDCPSRVVCRVLAFFLRGPPSCSGCCGANPGCVTPLRRCSRGEFPAWKGRSTAQASTDPRREEGLHDLSKKGALRSPALSPFFRPTVAGVTLEGFVSYKKDGNNKLEAEKPLLMPLAKGRQRYGPR